MELSGVHIPYANNVAFQYPQVKDLEPLHHQDPWYALPYGTANCPASRKLWGAVTLVMVL